MTLKIEISEHENLIVMRALGITTAEQLAAEYARLFADPRFRINMNVMWDLSELKLYTIPISEIRRLPKLLNPFSSRRGENYKVALVTSRVTDFQLLRIYIALLRLIGSFRLRVFSCPDEARAWLHIRQAA